MLPTSLAGLWASMITHYKAGRAIFLIFILKEVFLRSVILFQPDFCFMNEDLRFRLRSWEVKR